VEGSAPAPRAALPIATGRLAALCCGGALLLAAQPRDTPKPLRHGRERTAFDYRDPHLADKLALLEKVNADRVRDGAPPLQYEPRASLVGDRFCIDATLSGATGHWDLQGRAPYLRWGLAGGVDFHAQNAFALSDSSGVLDAPLRELLLEGHAQMMAERPPDDGHRRTILDPLWTHVGFGVAMAGGEFRMTQEFTRVIIDWIELPAAPVSPGARVRVAARPLPAWELRQIELLFEPPPRALTLLEARSRGAYGYPSAVLSLRPRLPRGYVYSGGGRGDFPLDKNGAFELELALDHGAGHYLVVCHVRKRGARGGSLVPATAALIVAQPGPAGPRPGV
jgi:hypothetical protein